MRPYERVQGPGTPHCHHAAAHPATGALLVTDLHVGGSRIRAYTSSTQIIIKQGQIGTEMYLLVRGEVEVYVAPHVQHATHALHTPRMPTRQHAPRPVCAKASTLAAAADAPVCI